MRIQLPKLSLIAMVGASSSGKTTFAGRYFGDTFVLSSDFFRRMICDDENDQSVTGDAFELLYQTARKRLELGKRTVIDATSLKPEDRKPILDLAKSQDVPAVAIVLNIPEQILLERNEARPDRSIPPSVIKRHYRYVQASLKNLRREGFRQVYVLSQGDVNHVEISCSRLRNDRSWDHGPFDMIGDVHGCFDELEELLHLLGYRKEGMTYTHPERRKAVFLGDLTDRGPGNASVLRLVMEMVYSGNALCISGNHENKLERYLEGKNVQISHGLENTAAELEREGDSFKAEVKRFLSGLVNYYLLDGGKLVVTHAGIREEYIGRFSPRIRAFCLYGDPTGETDENGLPVRRDWAEEYRGKALVVYGHMPAAQVLEKNGTCCIDTGCVFGGKLTSFRYPECTLVSVPAHNQYAVPEKPL